VLARYSPKLYREDKILAEPETQAQAITWDAVKAKYVSDGLCHTCAAQAAWGHQLGWHYRSSRPWPGGGRSIKPPCEQCASTVATFPVEIPGSAWRRWPKGDRRPADSPTAAIDVGHSLTGSPGKTVLPAKF
jgi:hypothetical protein